MALVYLLYVAGLVVLAPTRHFAAASDEFYFRTSNDGNGMRCTTPTREPGQCILVQKCPPLLALLRDRPRPPGAIDFLKRSQCGVEGRYPLVCCSSKPSTAPVVPPPPTPPPPTAPAPPPPPVSLAGGDDDFTRHPNARLLPLGQCGEQFSERIIGGEITELDEYPWLVLLRYRSLSGNLRFLCGGVLVSKRYVLTASHCINGDLKGNRLVSVRLGEFDTTMEEDCVEELTGEVVCTDPPLDVNVEKVIPHPDYGKNSQHQTSDIGLLRMDKDVPMTEFIRPICLPVNDLSRNVQPGTNLWVAGWGRTENKSVSSVKLKVSVPVVSIPVCQEVYRSNNRRLQDTQMCAGGRAGKDSCTGDSGGPLMTSTEQNGKQIHTVAGIVSFGPRDCGMQGWPGVYTRVQSFMPWIMGELRP